MTVWPTKGRARSQDVVPVLGSGRTRVPIRWQYGRPRADLGRRTLSLCWGLAGLLVYLLGDSMVDKGRARSQDVVPVLGSGRLLVWLLGDSMADKGRARSQDVVPVLGSGRLLVWLLGDNMAVKGRARSQDVVPVLGSGRLLVWLLGDSMADKGRARSQDVVPVLGSGRVTRVPIRWQYGRQGQS